MPPSSPLPSPMRTSGPGKVCVSTGKCPQEATWTSTDTHTCTCHHCRASHKPSWGTRGPLSPVVLHGVLAGKHATGMTRGGTMHATHEQRCWAGSHAHAVTQLFYQTTELLIHSVTAFVLVRHQRNHWHHRNSTCEVQYWRYFFTDVFSNSVLFFVY